MNSSVSCVLDQKIRKVFPWESLLKNSDFNNVFSGYNIPSFLKDWIIKAFSQNDSFDRETCLKFLNEKVPHRGLNIRLKLLHTQQPIQILSRLIVQTDLLNGRMSFSIPDLRIGFKEGLISLDIAQNILDHLHEGEVWGILDLKYQPPENGSKGYVVLTDFNPFKPYTVDLEYFKQSRREFNTLEWIDLLIRTMEFNPDYSDPKQNKYFDLNKKMMLLSRLLVYVEPNLNMIELAPKGTGKSFVYNNISKYNWTVSGGIITRAGLFYNISTKAPGIIHHYDFIALDEIETLSFSREEEILGAFKNYLENGKIAVGNYSSRSDCGLMMLGNIKLDHRLRPRYRNFLTGLPDFFHSSAFVDRIHGFIEGWHIFRFNEDLKIKGLALNSEYYSEIMHCLRKDQIYYQIVEEMLTIPSSADTRDTKAVKKMCSAYLKIIFPHVERSKDISVNDFREFVLNPALQKRAIIRQQLAELDSEYSPEMPDISCK